MDMRKRVAIIGAGMAGASCAQALGDSNHHVDVFDKAGDVGGRMATRTPRDRSDNLCFDYGAQYFTVRESRFASLTRGASWVEWSPQMARHAEETDRSSPEDAWFVGTPSMPEAVRSLFGKARVHTSTRIARIGKTSQHYTLFDDDGHRIGEHYDNVVIAVPGPQAVVLVEPHAPRLAALGAAARLSPCWAAMIVTHALDPSRRVDVITPPKESPLAWIARNTSKPGRLHSAWLDGWVAHASGEWSAGHLDDAEEDVVGVLQAVFVDQVKRATGDTPRIQRVTMHRWRYAKAARPAPDTPPAAFENGLALCGDYLIGARVEAAYLSGQEAARLVLAG